MFRRSSAPGVIEASRVGRAQPRKLLAHSLGKLDARLEAQLESGLIDAHVEIVAGLLGRSSFRLPCHSRSGKRKSPQLQDRMRVAIRDIESALTIARDC